MMIFYFQTDSHYSVHVRFASAQYGRVQRYPTVHQHQPPEDARAEFAAEYDKVTKAAKIPHHASASHARFCAPPPVIRSPIALGRLTILDLTNC